MIQGQRSMPILSVKDVSKSIGFFVQGLGFTQAGQWKGDDGLANFAIVMLDGITIGLSYDIEAKGSGENWAAYFYVSDIEAFAAHIQSNGVILHREVTEQFYGCRDLEIVDVDQNKLCFGQDLSPDDNGPGL